MREGKERLQWTSIYNKGYDMDGYDTCNQCKNATFYLIITQINPNNDNKTFITSNMI